jgi:hypothetical protein
VSSNTKKEPPVTLVKTWCHLLAQNDDKAAKNRAAEMLTSAFGDMQTAANFIKKHKIAV